MEFIEGLLDLRVPSGPAKPLEISGELVQLQKTGVVDLEMHPGGRAARDGDEQITRSFLEYGRSKPLVSEAARPFPLLEIPAAADQPAQQVGVVDRLGGDQVCRHAALVLARLRQALPLAEHREQIGREERAAQGLDEP